MGPKKIFVDTSAWINFLLEGEPGHREAGAYMEKEIKKGAKLLTSNLVLVETATRLLYDHSLRVAQAFRRQVEEAEKQRRLAVLWVDEPVLHEAWEVFEKFAEHKLSLTDATSVVLMKRMKLSVIFAFDDDFRKVGLRMEPILSLR